MPSATLTLVIALDEPLELSGGPLGLEHRRLGVSVAGLHTSPVTIHHDGRMRGMQLDLTPAGCRALLGCPAAELADRAQEGADVFGALADRIREQLHETSDAARQLRVVAKEMGGTSGAAPMDDRLSRAWAHLETARGLVSVADLADDSGWSTRHFTQRFTKEFGRGPRRWRASCDSRGRARWCATAYRQLMWRAGAGMPTRRTSSGSGDDSP